MGFIKDTLEEDSRKGNYIWIFPSKTSDIYDNLFATSKPSNKLLYKYLYTNEILQIEEPLNFPISMYAKWLISPSTS